MHISIPRTVKLTVLGSGVVCAAYLISASGVLSQVVRTGEFERRAIVDNPLAHGTAALTLQQAFDVTRQAAVAWSASARLVELQSLERAANAQAIDAPDAGLDGTRPDWQALFVAADKPDLQLRVTLRGGLVGQVLEETRVTTLPPITRTLALDSPAAARIASARLAVQEDKGHGLAFDLATDNSGRTFLTVLGSYRHSSARVDFDATSGQLVRSIVQTQSAGGILYSSDAGATWKASTLRGGQVMGLVRDAAVAGTAYAVMPTLQSIDVFQTSTFGENWARIASLPAAAGTWAYSITGVRQSTGPLVLGVGTPSGLYVSRDTGRVWTPTAGLPAGPAQWLGVSSVARPTMLVSISAGPNAGVYASPDLLGWTRILNGSHRISSLDDGQAVALPETPTGQAQLIRDASVSPLQLPVPALRMAGRLAPGKTLVADAGNATTASTTAAATWQTAVQRQFASVAVSPGGGVAIAGGFRNGIFRSLDGGTSWSLALASPAQVLPGNNEITGVTFFDDQHVVVVNGGMSTWQSF